MENGSVRHRAPPDTCSEREGMKIDLGDVQTSFSVIFNGDHTRLLTLRRELPRQSRRIVSRARRGSISSSAARAKSMSRLEGYEATGGKFIVHDKADEILRVGSGPVPRTYPEKTIRGDQSNKRRLVETILPEDQSLVFNTSRPRLLAGCAIGVTTSWNTPESSFAAHQRRR